MADWEMAAAIRGLGENVREGLETVAGAVDRLAKARDRATRESLESMGDDKLERLERVLEGLKALRES